jgi:hypothetical protein
LLSESFVFALSSLLQFRFISFIAHCLPIFGCDFSEAFYSQKAHPTLSRFRIRIHDCVETKNEYTRSIEVFKLKNSSWDSRFFKLHGPKAICRWPQQGRTPEFSNLYSEFGIIFFSQTNRSSKQNVGRERTGRYSHRYPLLVTAPSNMDYRNSM